MENYESILKRKLKNNLIYFEEVGSTNDVAKKNENLPHGTIIVANGQTAGRGTFARGFYSKKRSGIYMTVVIDLDEWHFKDEALATLYLAVAASDAIEEITGIKTDIKWINDLFLNSKKLGGILVEKEFSKNTLIAGIGINISGKKENFPDELQNVMVSLEIEDNIDFVKAGIVNRLYDKIFMASELSNSSVMLEKYKNRFFLLGEKVEILIKDEITEAVIMDVAENGHLLIDINGKKLSLSVGKVRIKA